MNIIITFIEMESVGCLIAFKLRKDVKSTARTKFFRELYGCVDKSNYKKYTYIRKGILDDIPHIQLSRAAIIVRNEYKEKILKFLQHDAIVETRKVVLQKDDKIKFAKKS